MQLSEDGRPIIRFSMMEKWWQNRQAAMERYFIEEPEHFGTKWMAFGSHVAESLEQRPLPWWLSDVPPADISEYRIVEDFEGTLVRGTLDKFMKDKNTVIDNKTLKRKMTPREQKEINAKLRLTLEDFVGLKNKFDEKDAVKYKKQLVFYQVLVEHRHGSVDPEAFIEVIPVIEDINGLVRRTGEPSYQVLVPITDEDRAEMKKKIIETAKDINICWEAFKAGNIKL